MNETIKEISAKDLAGTLKSAGKETLLAGEAIWQLQNEVETLRAENATLKEAALDGMATMVQCHELAKEAKANMEMLHAECVALKEAQRWIPVGERLPDHSRDVLVTIRYSNDRPFVRDMAYLSGRPGKWIFGDGDDFPWQFSVTHWCEYPPPCREWPLPLSPPPKGGE